LDDAMKKLKLEKMAQVDKLSLGKFTVFLNRAPLPTSLHPLLPSELNIKENMNFL